MKRAWKLFGLIPILLLQRPSGKGYVGRDELERRADEFGMGAWSDLLSSARANARFGPTVARQANEDVAASMSRRGNYALTSVRIGEISRARQRLTGAALAPRNEATFRELQD